MENLIIEKTDKTPYVFIDCDTGKVSIEGICIPENPHGFFEPIRKKIDCLKKTNSQIIFDIYLEYFNTGASKALLDLFMSVADAQKEQVTSKVIWKIEDENDEEARESGEILEEISKIPFEYKVIDA